MDKGETGPLRLKRDRFNLPILIEDIVESIAGQSTSKDLEIISFIDPSTPEDVKGDPDRLKQLLKSLVGMVIMSADYGDVSIQVRLEEETIFSSSVAFSISFVGTAGFSESQKVIQKSHGDVGDTIISEFGGINSGLHVSRRILAEMGSTIRVINTPEDECEIIFTIRFERDALVTIDKPAIEFNGIRILVADDNLTSQQVLTKMLEAMGCRVKTVSRGIEVHPALVRAVLTNAPFRAVLLDMEMPLMDGERALRSLRQDDLTKNTKVIGMMPIGHRNKLENNPDSGCSNYLFKPARRSELRNILEATLGLRQATPPENVSIKTEKVAESRDTQGLKILLVEDEELNQKMGSFLLGHLGYAVDIAFSGADAVAKIETRDYDLVFMDVHMPVMNGLEATRRIRSLKSDRKNIPIIAMTGNDIVKYRQICLEADMDDYLTKPFDPQRISQIVTAYTGGHYRKKRESPMTTEAITTPVEAPLLDVSVGMSIFDNDPISYKEFLKEFLEGLPKRIEKMVFAIDAEDWEYLGNEAHNLKGISANLGAMKVSTLASRLEARSRERKEEPAHSTLCEIKNAISELVNQAPYILSPIKSLHG